MHLTLIIFSKEVVLHKITIWIIKLNIVFLIWASLGVNASRNFKVYSNNTLGLYLFIHGEDTLRGKNVI